MRTAEEIRAAIREREREKYAIEDDIRGLQTEYGEAKVREAPVNPLLGKKVWRITGPLSQGRHQYGVVRQHTGAHRLYGRRGINPEPGEYFVASPSGGTFYAMNRGRPWEPGE